MAEIVNFFQTNYNFTKLPIFLYMLNVKSVEKDKKVHLKTNILFWRGPWLKT